MAIEHFKKLVDEYYCAVADYWDPRTNDRRDWPRRREAAKALYDYAEKLEAALRANIGEPQQVPDTRIVGGSLEEYLLDEWVCVHCGRHGDSVASIAHEDDCNYIVAKAALEA